MSPIIGIILGIVLGGGASYLVIQALFKSKVKEANDKADITIKEAELTAKRKMDEADNKAEKIIARAEQQNESVKQKKIQEARDNFAKLKSEFETWKAEQKVEIKERELTAVAMEKELKIKQDAILTEMETIESREQEINAIRENLDVQMKIVSKKKEELDTASERFIKELETISKLTESQAKEQLLDAVRAKSQNDAMVIEKEAIANAHTNANKEAKKIVIQTIQRMCAEITIENSVSVFNLESDEIKGQIIGREGRNIRALEAATGAEIVVDDTPEAIVISSFDPIRRELCRLSLKKLVADGRIHPAKIEETVAKVRKQLDEQIVEIGERTISIWIFMAWLHIW